jgi:hypothetical protein
MKNKHDMQTEATELLINAFKVTHPHEYGHRTQDAYEFVINVDMRVIEGVKIVLPTAGISKSLMSQDSDTPWTTFLFELNHVRVNPKMDNALIVHRLTSALRDIGVRIEQQPHQEDMRMCYKPLGEISDCVRFYITENRKIIFLCPTVGPKLAYSSKSKTITI